MKLDTAAGHDRDETRRKQIAPAFLTSQPFLAFLPSVTLAVCDTLRSSPPILSQ